MLPLLVASRDENAERLVRLMAESSSAKEVVMATQEVVETIELMSQSSEQYDDEQDSAPPFQQLACILMVYSLGVLHSLPRCLLSSLLSLLQRSLAYREESKHQVRCYARFSLSSDQSCHIQPLTPCLLTTEN